MRRAAYLELSRYLRPDRLAQFGIHDRQHEARTVFAQAVVAMTVLTDERRRTEYVATFTSLRIEDSAGRVSFQLQQDEQAKLIFAGRQSTFFEGSNQIHTLIDPAATKVWWRPYPGTGEWLPLPVAYLAFEGEQHGFRKAENINRRLEAELYFYGAVFGFAPADRIDPVTIENLPERP